MGIAVATAPVVSYNYGAQNYGKIKETTRYSFITIAISSVLILAVSYIYGKDIIHLFVGNGNVFSLTWDGLKLFSTVFVFIGLNVFLSGYFTALGNGFISAVISMLRSLFLVVIFILVLPKLMGVSGTWTAKIKKIYSRGKTYAEKLSAGFDERLSLISKLEDPDNGGTERVQLMSCWLDELTLQAFENGKITEDEFSGGFVGFKYLDTIADPCV